MSYEDLLNRIELDEEAAGPGSGVAGPGSEGATTEDNVAYLPSQLGVVKPGRRKKKKRKKRPVEESWEDYGESGFVKDDGILVENDSRDEHADVLEDEPSLRGSAEYRIYPENAMGETFIVVRAHKELTRAQIKTLNDLMMECPEHIEYMLVERLSSPMMDGRIEPIDDDWPEEMKKDLAFGRNVKSIAAQFHESLEEAMEDDMTKLRQDLKPALIRLFEGDPFHLVETDARLWASRFGVDQYLSEDAPLVAIENKIRGVQNLAGTLLQNYGNDRGYLEMVIDAMGEREPLSSFDGFKENDYLYGTRIRSNHEGVEMVFEASLDPLYVVSETVYIENDDVLDRWEELVGGIKRVKNVVYPQGERFTPDTLQQLEHAIIDHIDDQEEVI